MDWFTIALACLVGIAGMIWYGEYRYKDGYSDAEEEYSEIIIAMLEKDKQNNGQVAILAILCYNNSM